MPTFARLPTRWLSGYPARLRTYRSVSYLGGCLTDHAVFTLGTSKQSLPPHCGCLVPRDVGDEPSLASPSVQAGPRSERVGYQCR
ncbi:hypothetical protein K431DRAFT_283106 [Polychaeton citri CBS 116435]|uniref:Uncharacterized protein n=1 Tax=Polychaeton citri CBS 116435 TaxID=1314669 RepID=A0A9P4UPC0_9PEZI|nr:hypothetical protein K431DRAFT_283106 [Polychaeton citri CBS 116435]